MVQELTGKVAIVTGGLGGIGRATAQLLAAQGASVVIADLNADAGTALASELGANMRFKQADVGNGDDIKAVVDFAIEEFGGLHIMFNNAGISGAQYPRFLDDDLADFHRVIDINLFGVMAGCLYAGRHMSKHGGGVIINNASIAGIMAGQALMTYRASKAAMIQFSKSVAIDLAEYNIRVNCLAPGHIRTPLTAFSQPGMSAEEIERVKLAVSPAMDVNQPLKRHGKPDDVAQAVLFLCSDRAAQITGVVLPVDGGISAGDSVNHLQAIIDARADALKT